jgi:hypothetical protein
MLIKQKPKEYLRDRMSILEKVNFFSWYALEKSLTTPELNKYAGWKWTTSSKNEKWCRQYRRTFSACLFDTLTSMKSHDNLDKFHIMTRVLSRILYARGIASLLLKWIHYCALTLTGIWMIWPRLLDIMAQDVWTIQPRFKDNMQGMTNSEITW